MDGEVHQADPPGRLVALLPVDGDLVGIAAVGLDEAPGLHKQTAGTAGGVEHAALERLQHFDEQSGNRPGSEELAPAVAFGASELLDEVPVDATEDVSGLLCPPAEADL